MALRTMKEPGYTEEFYLKLKGEEVVYSAEKTLSVVIEKLPPVSSVVDVGCGVGTWLSSFAKLQDGEVDLLGIDGPWVDPGLLVIPEEKFLAADLSVEMPSVSGKYDLAISLEVAEHLPPERAEAFVGFLTGMSDFVLFSAAIPFQGGTNHFNEQWQDYWADLFERKGYVPADFIRPVLWSDDRIPVHYRQNTILYLRERRLEELDLPGLPDRRLLSLCHPECYSKHTSPGVRRAFRIFRGAVGRYVARKLYAGRGETG